MNAGPPSGTMLFGRQEARLSALDSLPRPLWLGSLINSQGSLEPRLRQMQRLREALCAGGLPDPACAGWPHAALAAALHETFDRLELPRLCLGARELADQVLSSMLWHLDRIVDYVDRGDGPDAAAARALEAFGDDWRERRGMVEELVEVFGEAGALFENANWDALRGLLVSEGWQEVVRIRRLIAALPGLAELLRQLGRSHPSEDADDAAPVDALDEAQASEPVPRPRLTHVPEMPGETRGVCRSGRIARMLPSETLLFANPRLRLVWHARRAERSLLTYEEDERALQIEPERAAVSRSIPSHRPGTRMESGPMLVCVDTSGSMQGGAEAVAKAVVLEAMRTAHAQRRACRVYAFGGPDEIVEMELDLDLPGVERLADFLGQAFRGGTDVCGPLERALARLAEERWRLADLLIASDGEFGATAATASAVARAKEELGLRVQGVLTGDRETIGMLELADDVFWVRDWRRYGGVDVDSPVETKSLTAAYFPGALRSPARNPAVGGHEASRAVFPVGKTRDA